MDIMGFMISTDAKVTTRLGDRIGLARRWARVDAQVLAAQVGVARKTVTAWEECRTEPTVTQLRAIASALQPAFQPLTVAALKSWIEDGEEGDDPPALVPSDLPTSREDEPLPRVA